MYEEIEIIKEQLNSIEKESVLRDAEEYKIKQEINRYKTILLEFLKSKIGHKIYWAHKNWRKYETHTIEDVSVDIQENNFFGEEYTGKECIKILCNIFCSLVTLHVFARQDEEHGVSALQSL